MRLFSLHLLPFRLLILGDEMGGCASTPQVLTEEFNAPLPLPPPAENDCKHDEITKDIMVVEECNVVAHGESHIGVVVAYDNFNESISITDISTQDEEHDSEQVKDEIFEIKEASEPSKSMPQLDDGELEYHSLRESPEPEIPHEAAFMVETSEPDSCVEKTIEEVKEVGEIITCVDEHKLAAKMRIAIEDTPSHENETYEDLGIFGDKIEEKQIISEEKSMEMKTEEQKEEIAPDTCKTTEESKKSSGSKKQYWPIAALLRNPLGNFAKTK
ncbi:unnamed protein product [Cuscuta epithymum]|uniref:Uncharacterized protein n=1 Tax=Cuscuta epithymum TaxID=186058 RepID=A0AAV0DJF7_9ASTE|nr:unnamed protein product [Cuscuta epithymum]